MTFDLSCIYKRNLYEIYLKKCELYKKVYIKYIYVCVCVCVCVCARARVYICTFFKIKGFEMNKNDKKFNSKIFIDKNTLSKMKPKMHYNFNKVILYYGMIFHNI